VDISRDVHAELSANSRLSQADVAGRRRMNAIAGGGAGRAAVEAAGAAAGGIEKRVEEWVEQRVRLWMEEGEE
jgi:outer membrane lipoprotein SlyB